ELRPERAVAAGFRPVSGHLQLTGQPDLEDLGPTRRAPVRGRVDSPRLLDLHGRGTARGYQRAVGDSGGRVPVRGDPDLPHSPSPRVPGRVARARAGDGGPRAGAAKQHAALPQLPQPGGEGVPDLPDVRVGAEEAVHQLRQAAQPGVGPLPLLRHGPAQRQEDGLV
ncbi:MAG: Type II secretory pathway, ATPase PulE/Tfp pilus assembly pathway, ATPase PilB, partial [uncultured Rubrobacteraceae bacterium]